MRVWISDVGDSLVIDISELGALEQVDWDVVRGARIALNG